MSWKLSKNGRKSLRERIGEVERLEGGKWREGYPQAWPEVREGTTSRGGRHDTREEEIEVAAIEQDAKPNCMVEGIQRGLDRGCFRVASA